VALSLREKVMSSRTNSSNSRSSRAASALAGLAGRARAAARRDAGSVQITSTTPASGFDPHICLTAQESRPSLVYWRGNATKVKVLHREDMRADILQGSPHHGPVSVNAGMLQSTPPGPPTKCSRLVPKLLHFIWMGSSLQEKHALNIAGFVNLNPKWRIWIWVDTPIIGKSWEMLSKLLSPGGEDFEGITVKQLQDYQLQFRNFDIINRSQNLAGKSDYTRLELLFLFGGVYLDTDSIAVHGFDDYGTLFRWPFMAYDTTDSKTITNSLIGVEQGSHFMDFALNATREQCVRFGSCGVMFGAGPSFVTGAFAKYNQSDISLLDYKFVMRGTDQGIGTPAMKQLFEFSWQKWYEKGVEH